MLFDTDVVIWVEKGGNKAAEAIDREKRPCLSVQSYMELMQGATSRAHQESVKQLVAKLRFEVLPLSERIGHRALVYVESYGLSSGLKAGDAIIAATAVEHDLELCSGNARHFRVIKGLRFRALHHG